MTDWIKELLAVDVFCFFAPVFHKVVLMVIMLYSPIWNERGEFWWEVYIADHLAHLAALEKKAFLKHLSYLHKKLGLFDKKHSYLWDSADSTKKVISTDLYIRPKRG